MPENTFKTDHNNKEFEHFQSGIIKIEKIET